MMSKILLMSCFLFSFSLFAQQEEIKRDSIHIPTSLFAMHTFHNQGRSDSLYLTEFNFATISLNLFEQLNFKSLGRKFSLDGMKYNHQKKELNKYLLKDYKTMWDVSWQERVDRQN